MSDSFWIILFWAYFSISLLLVIISTIHHSYKKVQGLQPDEVFEHRNPNLWHAEEGSVIERIFLGFSLVKNWEKLWDTRSKYNANALITLRGIKVLFVIWLAGSIYWYITILPIVPYDEFKNSYSNSFMLVVPKSSISLVDCLLWLSGVYTVYGFCTETIEKLPRTEGLFKDYVSLYVIEIINKVTRLFVLILVSLLLFGWVSPILGSGPLFSLKSYFNTEMMKKYWYCYLLFINPFHPNIESQGMVWASFVALELHLFIIFLPLIGLLLHKRTLALVIISLFMLASLVGSFFWTIENNLNISPWVRPYDVIAYQQKFWNKAFPYGFGIITGLSIWSYHNEHLDGSGLEGIMNKIKLSKWLPLIMHWVGLLFIIIVILVYHPIENERNNDIKAVSSLLLLCSQVLIPVGLSLNLVPMTLNRSDRLRAFLSLPLFKPISHLLFIMVPLSGTLLIFVVYNLGDGLDIDVKWYFIYWIAFFIGLILLAFFISIVFISPFTNAVKVLLENYRYQDNMETGEDEMERPLTGQDESEEDSESIYDSPSREVKQEPDLIEKPELLEH